MEISVKAKRVFRKITTVTEFKPVKITEDMKIKSVDDENGAQIKFKRLEDIERFCEENDASYIEVKYTFYA
jgi:hypothetical protein